VVVKAVSANEGGNVNVNDVELAITLEANSIVMIRG
jgi:hypothetical protein